MRFYVNVDHVATIRQARRTDEPDPVEAALLAERAGADGITIHLREDRRHIQDADVRRMAEAISTVMNLELATASEIVSLAVELRPFQATLVPERREEITTEGGLALGSTPAHDQKLREVIDTLAAVGTRVSLFIDPDPEIIGHAADLGVAAIELHTGGYANMWPGGDAALERLAHAVQHARDAGLAVHAGHGLTYRNVQPVAAIAAIEELNIGHSIVSRAVLTGMDEAVRTMRGLIDGSR